MPGRHRRHRFHFRSFLRRQTNSSTSSAASTDLNDEDPSETYQSPATPQRPAAILLTYPPIMQQGIKDLQKFNLFFSGEGGEDIEQFAKRFEDVADRKKWNDAKMVEHLLDALQDNANDWWIREKLILIADAEQQREENGEEEARGIDALTYQFLLGHLKKAFPVPHHLRHSAMHQLFTLRQYPGETLEELRNRVRQLGDAGFPKANNEEQQETLKIPFIEAIADEQVKAHTLDSPANTLDVACSIAARMESSLRLGRQRSTTTKLPSNKRQVSAPIGHLSGYAPPQQEPRRNPPAHRSYRRPDTNGTNNESNDPCHHCGEMGHFATGCDKRKWDLQDQRSSFNSQGTYPTPTQNNYHETYGLPSDDHQSRPVSQHYNAVSNANHAPRQIVAATMESSDSFAKLVGAMERQSNLISLLVEQLRRTEDPYGTEIDGGQVNCVVGEPHSLEIQDLCDVPLSANGNRWNAASQELNYLPCHNGVRMGQQGIPWDRDGSASRKMKNVSPPCPCGDRMGQEGIPWGRVISLPCPCGERMGQEGIPWDRDGQVFLSWTDAQIDPEETSRNRNSALKVIQGPGGGWMSQDGNPLDQHGNKVQGQNGERMSQVSKSLDSGTIQGHNGDRLGYHGNPLDWCSLRLQDQTAAVGFLEDSCLDEFGNPTWTKESIKAAPGKSKWSIYQSMDANADLRLGGCKDLLCLADKESLSKLESIAYGTRRSCPATAHLHRLDNSLEGAVPLSTFTCLNQLNKWTSPQQAKPLSDLPTGKR